MATTNAEKCGGDKFLCGCKGYTGNSKATTFEERTVVERYLRQHFNPAHFGSYNVEGKPIDIWPILVDRLTLFHLQAIAAARAKASRAVLDELMAIADAGEFEDMRREIQAMIDKL